MLLRLQNKRVVIKLKIIFKNELKDKLNDQVWRFIFQPTIFCQLNERQVRL